MFPALEAAISTSFMENFANINLADPQETCVLANLCEKPNVMEMMADEIPLNLGEHVKAVNNNPKSKWVAGVNEKFQSASRKEVQRLMGTVVDPEWTIKGAPYPDMPHVVTDDLPTDFDARTNWPTCATVINTIRDQSNCGSCWAHGTTEALNDRTCIAGKAEFTSLLSVSDTTGCCDSKHCFSFGCNGGQVGTPWGWFTKYGVVTGGNYESGKMCYDYTMPACAHHVDSKTLPECDAVVQVQPKCLATCPSNNSISYNDDKHMAASSYGFGLDAVDKIKQDIYEYGTVTAAFSVYEDFLTYKSGVY